MYVFNAIAGDNRMCCYKMIAVKQIIMAVLWLYKYIQVTIKQPIMKHSCSPSQNNCLCCCSLRYHNLKPNYIHDRLRQLANSYLLRVLLVQVDVVCR